MSTFALTLYTVRQHTLPDGTQCDVNIWDTAGQEVRCYDWSLSQQENHLISCASRWSIHIHTHLGIWWYMLPDLQRFESLHPSYFHRAHAAILAFDITRKVTYKSLERWYSELRTYCPHCPAICIANKIDVDYRVTQVRAICSA